MSELTDRVDTVVQKIIKSCEAAKRDPASIKLVAVSKGQSAEKIIEVAHALKAKNVELIFGENYLQEFEEKRSRLLHLGAQFHYIGKVQSGKLKSLATYFDCIQSIESRIQLEKLEQLLSVTQSTRDLFIQVNISNDPKKGGVLYSVVPEMVKYVLEKNQYVRVRGLMTILAADADPATEYEKMNQLREKTVALTGEPLALSQGMSADFEIAILHGADYIRVGTALFGERK